MKTHAADGQSHEMTLEESGQVFRTHFRETDWNGIPAYIKYVKDVTEEANARKERARLEQYFQTMVQHLPGGIAVIHYDKEGNVKPEFLSKGFAEMTGMTLEEAWALYEQDAMTGVHPEDRNRLQEKLQEYFDEDRKKAEFTYRLKRGEEDYFWVRCTLTMIQSEEGEKRVYADYYDMTKEREEKEEFRRHYNDLIMQHYRVYDPRALIMGHCNVTKNRIMEILDYTDSALLATLGYNRSDFFMGLSDLILKEKERKIFQNTFLNEPALTAFQEGRIELTQKCFVKLPKEEWGRYVQVKMNMVETPDTGDITGILTVLDVTEETITTRMMQQLSMESYDLVLDVDLVTDTYHRLTEGAAGEDIPKRGTYSEELKVVLQDIVPKDRKRVEKLLAPDYIRRRLQQEGTYSFGFSDTEKTGSISTRTLKVSAVDSDLERICLTMSDITESVREQQRLLTVIAYTFELLVLIQVETQNATLYTRQMVLNNLPSYTVENYDEAVERDKVFSPSSGEQKELAKQFLLENLRRDLEEKPQGFDFILPHRVEETQELRYKKISIMWGSVDKKTICMVQADVTDMLASERESKEALQQALQEAEEANRAKSEFLSSMSHDIRTPMNAIMGMTTLALNHMDDRVRAESCLEKISYSSKHLLSLINDILDMSKIERSKITLNRLEVFLPDMVEQLSAIMAPQAQGGGLEFRMDCKHIRHPYFYGDALRVNQILINILGNAIKFTPEGGTVSFTAEEIAPKNDPEKVRYRFTVTDTGVGMSEEFIAHVFEPFTRYQNTTRVEGSGLGLSITKGLVGLMEGEIFVESQVHKGTSFSVELEFEAASGSKKVISKDAEKEEDNALAGCCFLLVEDNPINSEILCELMQIYGVETVVRENGSQAVSTFQGAAAGTYDAILMDIQMPVMNGYDATRAIRALPRPDAKTIPIIAMTANAFTEDIQASLEAGMDAHVAKPIDMDLLYRTVSRVLREKRK